MIDQSMQQTATQSSSGRTQADPQPPLRVVGATKSYTSGGRRVEALRGLDLTIESSGFFAIMGQSGSGKSTLLHLLAALDRPDTGEIYIAGRAIHQLSEREATYFRRSEIGIVFQQFNLIPSLTAKENIELPGMLAGKDAAFLDERSSELLAALGLEGRGHHRPDALSGGEQQRVAIARALLFSPPVLFADEPTGNLDSANSEKLWKMLGDIAAERKMLVVMVTHEPAAAVHCERVFVIRDGKVSSNFSTEGLDAAGVASCYQQCIRQA
jgi:putative ABC transport system ATP-binding protein